MPGTDLSGLDLGGVLGSAVTRLQRQTTTLGELSQWPGIEKLGRQARRQFPIMP